MSWWPFGRKQQALDVEVSYREEPVPDSADRAGSWDLEMTIPIRKLAALYMEQGWLLAIDEETAGTPLPNGVLAFIVTQLEELAESDATYSALGRLMFLKDQDFPNDIDIYLHVGTATLNPKEDPLV